MNYLIIACFAFFGGIMRYVLSFVSVAVGGFPLGTLLANFLGCFFISWLVKQLMVAKKIHPRWVLGVGTGFCGGLTTFSTFTLDSINLLQQQAYGLALLYVGSSITGGLFFIWLGEYCSRKRGIH